MIKHIVLLLLLSAAIVFGMPYAEHGMELLLTAHGWISERLTDVFSGASAGNMIRNFVALLAIPVAAGLIPSVLFWIVKRYWFPYFMTIVWIVWLVQIGALTAIGKIG